MQRGLNLLLNIKMLMILLVLIPLWLVQLAEPKASSIPGDEVNATIGQPVLLKCDLGKPLNPSEIRIYWQGRKPSDSLNEFPEVLHFYNKGVEEFDNQDSRYRNRTNINRDLIHQGNLSLLIRDTKVYDDNTQFIVLVQENDQVQGLCKKTLRVAARFQKPEVSVTCMERAEELRIECMSQGGFPEPMITWSGLNNLDNNTPSTVTVNQTDSTYSIRSVLWVNLTKDQTVTCYVTNPTLQETVNSSITPRGSCADMAPPDHKMTGFIGMAVLFVVTVTGCVMAILYKRKCNVYSCSDQCCCKAQVLTSDPDEEKGLQEMRVT